MKRHVVALLLTLLVPLLACSGPEDILAEAGSALRAGRIEEAESLVAPLEGEEADAFRARLAGARTHRGEVRAELAALRARVPREERTVVFDALRALAAGERDPVLQEEIGFAKTRVYDAYASASRTWNRGAGGAGSTEPPEGFANPALEAEPPPPPANVRSEGAEGARAGGSTRVSSVPASDSPAEAATGEGAERMVPAPSSEREEGGVLSARARLRRELAAGFVADAASFVALGCAAVDEAAGLRFGTRWTPWDELTLAQWSELGRTTSLSAPAALGLVEERLVRGDEYGAWRGLRRLLREERIEAQKAYAMIADHRGEPVPEGGYVYDGRDWIAARAAEERTREKHIADLRADFARAEGEARDELFDEFLHEDLGDELRAALQERWNALAARFDRLPAARRLRELAARREELDRRRRSALALIFDEQEYFYPYDPPACPPEKAKLYPAVQRRVDVLVGRVREVWDEDLRVPLRGALREIVEEARWLARREDEWGKASILPEELPHWILGIDPRLASIGLADFAWDEEEGAALALSRAVRARNRRLWESGEFPENGRAAAKAPLRQVEITNDYRQMLGRRALAWNPLIQAAAHDHSQYMADTGDFGHTEPDPERRGPGERMKRRGYDRGTGENCHAGGGDPMGAHVGWCHSSGHHRNLLAVEHREMASGLAGPYWTQDFGADESFLEELPAWFD